MSANQAGAVPEWSMAVAEVKALAELRECIKTGRTRDAVDELHRFAVEVSNQAIKPDNIFWPPKTKREEHLYEIRHGKTKAYVLAQVEALERMASPAPSATREQLFGRAMVILKALDLGTNNELHPDIKKEIAAICAEFEAGAASGAGREAGK